MGFQHSAEHMATWTIEAPGRGEPFQVRCSRSGCGELAWGEQIERPLLCWPQLSLQQNLVVTLFTLLVPSAEVMSKLSPPSCWGWGSLTKYSLLGCFFRLMPSDKQTCKKKWSCRYSISDQTSKIWRGKTNSKRKKQRKGQRKERKWLAQSVLQVTEWTYFE